jgi:hypothetical protein
MGLKVSNPYGADDTYKSGSAIVDAQNAKASGKAKMRFPDPPLMPGQKNGQAGKNKRPALTPGSSPSGS